VKSLPGNRPVRKNAALQPRSESNETSHLNKNPSRFHNYSNRIETIISTNVPNHENHVPRYRLAENPG
jgi:hypothetical protein